MAKFFTSSTCPKFLVIDFETVLNGVGSLDFWHPGFRAASMAASWRDGDAIRSLFFEGEDAILQFLGEAEIYGIGAVVHNMGFELGVLSCRFPSIRSLAWLADTMRMVQCWDNGGDAYLARAPSLDDLEESGVDDADDGDTWIGGLGLANATQRILGRPDHKAEAYAYLRALGVKAGQEGKNLNRLPRDILERYNVADTEETLRLYEHLVAQFEKIGYDWRLDHSLYMSSVRFIVGAQIKGVRVDRERLDVYRREVAGEIAAIEADFRGRFMGPIAAVERERLLDAIRQRKTLRGRKGFIRRYRDGARPAAGEVQFNVGSNQQLARLFMGELGIQPRFFAAKGAPSFKSSVLDQWGEGGAALKTRRKRMIVLKQAEALYELSAVDGRWHVPLKACGTSTGRMSGGQA